MIPLRQGYVGQEGETMKKCLILFLCIFTTDSFASGIATNAAFAPCTNNTLETYSGNSNLAADWQPNEIQLRWYNNNTLMTVQTAANTCVYDGTLTIPATAPTRTGYTFDGWTVRPKYDFSTLNVNAHGVGRLGISLYNNAENCVKQGEDYANMTTDCSDNDFVDLSLYEWKVVFNWGTIYGSSYCSARSGNTHGYEYDNAPSNWTATYSQLENATGTKENCWCQATGYKPINSDILYGQLSDAAISNWIFHGVRQDECTASCAHACAYYTRTRIGFRRALFGVVQ